MMGKSFNAAAYAVIYMFSAELFPTVIRNSCLGISSVCARVGGILGDYVLLLVSFKNRAKRIDVIKMQQYFSTLIRCLIVAHSLGTFTTFNFWKCMPCVWFTISLTP